MSVSKANMFSSDVDIATEHIKELYCVEYPGKVVNVDQAINTLGGIENLSNVFSSKQKKLELRYHPENKFCTAVGAEFNTTTSLLLKVVKYKKKIEDKPIRITTQVIGKIIKTFAFKNLADYQFLPVAEDGNDKVKSIEESIVPQNVVPMSWLSEDAPEFLVPSFFSRMDTVQSYLTSGKIADNDANVVGRTRDRRSNYVKFATHDTENIPLEPYLITMKYIQSKMVTNEEILEMKELFDRRPVWTKMALASVSKFANVQLKYLLALRSYYFISGPYRISWVKFGYDPRKEPSAMQYQIIDYRVRPNLLTALIEMNPNLYSAGYRRKMQNFNNSGDSTLDEACYVFRPGCIPPLKQMFYQACDIKIPEVEERLKQQCAVCPKYNSKYGWLSENVFDFIREQIDKHIMAVLQQNGPSCSNSLANEQFFQRKITAFDDDDMSSGEDDSMYEFSDEDAIINNDVEHKTTN